MYKLLIVDDEAIVREGIEHNIEWSGLGFDFVGSCENGADAAAAVERLRPEVVITDICMPFGDGLDLTELIVTRFPGTKVILLSGFSEFAYAQRAVKLGAYDYVLKPITAAELRGLLRRVRAELDREADRSSALHAADRTLSNARAARLQRFTEALLARKPDGELPSPEQIGAQLQELSLGPPPGTCVVVSCCLDPPASGLSAAGRDAALDGLFETLGPSSFLDHDGRVVAVVAAEDGGDALHRAREIGARLLAGEDGAERGALTVGIGSSFDSPEGFADSYFSAVRSLEYRFIEGAGSVIDHRLLPAASPNRAPATNVEWSPEFRSHLLLLSRSLRACDKRECARAVELLAGEVSDGFISLSRARLQIHSILIHINEVRAETGMKPVSFEALELLPTLDSVKRRIEEICFSVVDERTGRCRTYGGSKADEALGYIQAHFASPSLSLKGICSELGVSTSYFSSIFKARTGTTFVERLTEMRMDRAKQLLKTTDLKSYEIAERVGYQDRRYFCTLFRKVTGRSPTEFRRETAGFPADE